jgi:hypothetical protein
LRDEGWSAEAEAVASEASKLRHMNRFKVETVEDLIAIAVR